MQFGTRGTSVHWFKDVRGAPQTRDEDDGDDKDDGDNDDKEGSTEEENDEDDDKDDKNDAAVETVEELETEKLYPVGTNQPSANHFCERFPTITNDHQALNKSWLINLLRK